MHFSWSCVSGGCGGGRDVCVGVGVMERWGVERWGGTGSGGVGGWK